MKQGRWENEWMGTEKMRKWEGEKIEKRGNEEKNVKIGKYGNVEMIASGKCFFNFHIFIFSHFPIVKFA
jgi:hypothetical protein